MQAQRLSEAHVNERTYRKAAVIRCYGKPDVFQVEEIDLPQIRPDQMLVRVHATSINPIEWKMRKGMLKLLTGNKFPMVLGFDLSGEVVEVGSQVTKFKPGDLVYACLDQAKGGAYAEYVAVSEKVVALKPTNLTHEQAAAVPLAAMTALQGIRDQGQFKVGQRVLINGASGGVGVFAIQVAKVLGAGEVVGVCSSANLERVMSLGADRVIDYAQQDFTQQQFTPEQDKYDLVFDVVGNRSLSDCQSVLQPWGRYVTTQPYPNNYFQSFLTSLLPGQRYKVILLKTNGVDLAYLTEQIEAGKIQSVIDRTYSLSQMAEAHAYSETERAVGKIVIAIGD
ncbi:MAG: NAD(P)-dependent alcohol dehydrogenase [Timaviella obliquedivisa GSE-PSE-MK23-08B]|jgi:2-desacetyl-2-hydroxyethyl bacteriochlorophyllide A dehydrogenase|nr:NAD(P)-dependent alcohol dehydrogenase [Timaviella obliquedivisa GSE-PSE-MK23-08B]